MPPDEPVEMSKAQLSGEMQRLAGYLEHIHDRTDELTKSNVGLREEWERANKLQAERNDQLEKGRRFNRKWALTALAIGIVSLLAVAAAGIALYASRQTELRLSHAISQSNCRNSYRSVLSNTRDNDTQAILDLLNAAIAGKLKTPARIKAAEKAFQDTIARDTRNRLRLNKLIDSC